MSLDVLVAGGELEALVAALRLAEGGARVRVLAPGAGGLPHLAGGLGVLGPEELGTAALAADPFALIAGLDPAHPLARVGAPAARAALAWFVGHLAAAGAPWASSRTNTPLLTMTGRAVPVLARPATMAPPPGPGDGPLAIALFAGFDDLAGRLLASALRAGGHDAHAVAVAVPGFEGNAAACAAALDGDAAAGALAERLRAALPAGIRTVLMPAVLGVDRHADVVARLEAVLGARVLEVPTLPPGAPGLRLWRTLVRSLEAKGAAVQTDAGPLRADLSGTRCDGLRDGAGALHRADAFMLATGGVMAGGLEVDSHGRIAEPVLDVAVVQTDPLTQAGAEAVSAALERAGASADERFRPTGAAGTLANVAATGALLPGATPTAERSAEGIAVATAVAAADALLDQAL